MTTPSLPRTVGVCGIGQMGSAAAVCFRRAGYRVLLWARDPDKLRAAGPRLFELGAWADAHLGGPGRPGGAIHLEPDLARLDAAADAVLDCVIEDLEEKAALLRRLPASRDRGALFLSATSGLSITEMGRRGGCEHLLAGAHFWNPPHLMPLVEVVRGEGTPDAVMDRACALMADVGKVPVRVERDVPGFLGNRLMHAMWREALALVDQGVASPADIDRVVKLTFALRLPAVGPLENMDLIGLDATARIQRYLLPDLAAAPGLPACLAERVAAGRLGMKTGAGFYDWDRRDAAALVELRDRQIVRQLAFLREAGEL